MKTKKIQKIKEKKTMVKEFIGIRIRPMTRKKLEELAEKSEMSLSEYIRQILEKHVENS